MGMSASQARYLGLTARKNNNEYEAQQCAEQKTMLAMQMDMVATDYTKKVSNRELLFTQIDASSNTSSSKRLSYEIITNTNPFVGLNMRVVDTNGKVVVPNDQTAYFNQLQQNAIDAYTKAMNNRYFTNVTTNPNGSTSETMLTGQSYTDLFLSGTNNNPILDKNGNQIDVNDFKQKVKLMDAPSFHDFWMDNGYSSADLNPTNPNTKDKMYTQDDQAAQATYDSEIARITNLRSTQYLADQNCLDPLYLEKKLRSGEWTLEKPNPNKGDTTRDWVGTAWQSESSIADVADQTDDAAAEAEYTQQSQFFQAQDKRLELRMKQLDTEHSAIQTEMDSVKKVIDKNIEGSFKTFA